MNIKLFSRAKSKKYNLFVRSIIIAELAGVLEL